MTKSRNILPPRRPWTEAELELLRRNYADSRTDDLATALERSLQQVYSKAKKMGLAKSEAYMASPDACRLRRGDGARYQFPKGHVPANKGTRRPGHSPGNMASTQFKKGVRGRNWMPIGSHRINADGYLDRKIADTGYPPDDWKAVHRLVWIETHGPIPPKHVVAFKAGRRTTALEHITLDALELLTLADNLRRNSLHSMPPRLAEISRLRGLLTRQINKRTKDQPTP